MKMHMSQVVSGVWEFARKLHHICIEYACGCCDTRGSTAHGHADRYSDIEIGVFWNRAPTDDERRIAAGQV
jgi:hypothetical protein